MSIKNFIQPRPPIPKDLVQEVGAGGISVILELIRDAYFDLVRANIVDLTLDEDQITEEWYYCLLDRWRNQDRLSLRPIHQKGDKSRAKKQGKPPTVDFCFRSWSREVYFGVECKLVEADRKTLCDKYVEDGMRRFIDCRYSSKCSEGAMLGYVRRSKCDDVACQLRVRIAALPGNPTFTRTKMLHPFKDHYVSKHDRADCLSPFLIHHFLLLFVIVDQAKRVIL